MAHPTNRGDRHAARFIKGLRRLRVDRATHGADQRCECFAQTVRHGHGVFFARLADYPTICSGPCCGNPRRWYGEPTVQERRNDP